MKASFIFLWLGGAGLVRPSCAAEAK
jgi:hypothetical protein